MELRVGLTGFSPKLEKQLIHLLTQASSGGVEVQISKLNTKARPDLLLADYDVAIGRASVVVALKIWPDLPIFVVTSGASLVAPLTSVARSRMFTELSTHLRKRVAELTQYENDSIAGSIPENDRGNSGTLRFSGEALVVDDSAVAREHLAVFLRGHGLTAEQAGSAEEARLKLSRKNYQCMFLDINMPGMDGYTFCREIRKHNEFRNLKIVMVTGRGGIFDKARGALAGCTAYLVKPVQPERMMTTLMSIFPRKAG